MGAVVRRRLRRKVRPEHYPAPYAPIDLWERHGASARIAEEESLSVAGLLTGETARNLVRVFSLRQRLRSLGKDATDPVRHVHVVGAGVMGGDIAACCALKGLSVSLQDVAPSSIGPAVGRAAKLFADILGGGGGRSGTRLGRRRG